MYKHAVVMALAKVIADLVSDPDDIDFKSTGANSLYYKIAQKTKKKTSEKTRKRYLYWWTSNPMFRNQVIELIKDKAESKRQSSSCLETIGYDSTERDNISSELGEEFNQECSSTANQLTEELISTDLSDLIALWMEHHKLGDAYLRYVSLPLMSIMYSERQLNAIDTSEIIIHMDVTSSICKNPNNLTSNEIRYYALVVRCNESTMTIAEMISSQHDVQSISIFLKLYKSFVQSKLHKWPFAKAIVVDWNSIFINSLTSEWNGMSMPDYLACMFDFAVDRIKPNKEIIVILTCSVQFLKQVSRTIELNYPKLSANKDFYLGCISMMLRCKSFILLNEIFVHFIKTIIIPNKKNAAKSLKYLTDMMRDEDGEVRRIDDDTQFHQETTRTQCIDFIYNNNVGDAVHSNSPFYAYFNSTLTSTMDKIKDTKIVTNKYFAPDFAQHIVTSYMTYVPLWSGLCLDLVNVNICRVSNACVANYMRFVKQNLLQDHSNHSVAETIRILHQYVDQLPNKDQIDIPRKSSNEDLQVDLTNVQSPSDVPPKMNNGLVNDVQYYMRSRSFNIRIGRYICSTNAPISSGAFQITAKQFHTLAADEWIDGLVIDCYCMTHVSLWQNATYFSTQNTIPIGDTWRNKRTALISVFNISRPLKGKLLMPYLFQHHWRLLIIDIDEEVITLMDPYQRSTDKRRILAAFQNLLENSNSNTTFHALKNVKWTIKNEENRPFQPVTDTSNCGAYVMYYMECVGKNIPFKSSFDPLTYRNLVAETLLSASDNVKHLCLYCFGEAGQADEICGNCDRYVHRSCTQRGYESTSDEESDQSSKRMLRKRKPQAKKHITTYHPNSPSVFTCKLCKRCPL